MIQLSENFKEGIISTKWILKLNKDSRKIQSKSGQEKTYISYFTSFPQELYEFFNIKDDSLYLVKEENTYGQVIVTDTKPSLPVTYITVNLIYRRKKSIKEDRIPTTSFTLSKKFFNNLNNADKVIFKLHPKSVDRYRNKLGLITLKII
ncbi:hypothetical protein PXD04_08985 [Methanosphaera sp. ISO3-F5]|uniref:hypothetical protein n=1 Tax=Methanosphaera sp. ISO3-F5 TaxID=1452353 RepID=UPI002B257192|nr:hypothetical protein [Methanosphaera sp. ISO3-F5]WQH63822.1 hypothetical protein PXD04_08985 [Methanosphaera sp. ISO3-F5]